MPACLHREEEGIPVSTAGMETKVRVGVRVRPLLPNEHAVGSEMVLKYPAPTQVGKFSEFGALRGNKAHTCYTLLIPTSSCDIMICDEYYYT